MSELPIFQCDQLKELLDSRQAGGNERSSAELLVGLASVKERACMAFKWQQSTPAAAEGEYAQG